MSGPWKPQDGRYDVWWAPTPLNGRTRPTQSRSGSHAFLTAALVQAVLVGGVLALFLFVIPFVGMVLGAAFGIDMTVTP